MLFNSSEFLLFFPVVITLFFLIPKQFVRLWLLGASYYFYMSWNYKHIVLILFSTLITFAGAIALEKSRGKSIKTIITTLCILADIAPLILFKYLNFFIVNLNHICSFLGIRNLDYSFKYSLPVGISFFTFQSIGYIIDVYRGTIKPEKNFITYALFVSFFPQLVAGPIERSKNLLNQIKSIEYTRNWNTDRFVAGLLLMLWGFFMKLMIADRIAILVDEVFDNYINYGTTELLTASIGFAIQIYCDFGSYSLIAMGVAKIIGINLMENFNTPYFAVNIRDFWDRWHISLSTWFRDYVYIPLGGNRKGLFRTGLNKMIVFGLSGIWHGASWHFFVWGLLHGIFQVISDMTMTIRKKLITFFQIKTECFSWKLLCSMITFLFVDFTWIFFRASSLESAIKYIIRIFKNPNPWILFNNELYNLGLNILEMNILIISLAILFCVDAVRYKKKIMFDKLLLSQNLWFSWTVSIALLVIIIIFGRYGFSVGLKEFIYFQF